VEDIRVERIEATPLVDPPRSRPVLPGEITTIRADPACHKIGRLPARAYSLAS